MDGGRNNAGDMDLSGRSSGSNNSSMTQQQRYSESLSRMMQQQQQRYPQTTSGFPGRPMASPPGTSHPQQQQQQQQQRIIQMQMQQQQHLKYQQQQIERQKQYQMQQQQHQRRPAGNPSAPSPQSARNVFQPPAPSANILKPLANPPAVMTAPIPPPAALAAAANAKNTETDSVAAASATSSVGKTAKARKVSQSTSSTASSAATACPQEEQYPLVQQCNWVDKTLWLCRNLLGGQSVNGFLRATATVQRIKKQRARQTSKKDDASSVSGGKRDAPGADQESEESLKMEIMNTRTAKKMKSEMEIGIAYCAILHDTARKILHEMDPGIPLPPPLPSELPGGVSAALPQTPAIPKAEGRAPLLPPPVIAASPLPVAPRHSPMPRSSPQTQTSTVSSGNASGSTLRKQRKKKLPPSNEPLPPLPEFDASGKRTCTKKEYTFRLFEVLRFRALRKGDFVAARLSSRDLWILAAVLEDYPTHRLSPVDFLQLSEARRDQLFRDKVKVRDVEDKDGAPQVVQRSLILPLPRSFSEAAEWSTRYKKGSRVYAMYPQTTSLYSATVVDATTYCRDDDDIVVVEFDGDEPDATGSIPTCHIPARFVTLIPREFPASQPPNAKTKAQRRGTTGSVASTSNSVAAAAAAALDGQLNLDEDFDFDGGLPGLEFDDLDFNL